MAFERLMQVGIAITGRLDPSLNQAVRAAQGKISTFGETLKRDVNSALAGPRHQMEEFLGREVHRQLTYGALATQAALGGAVWKFHDYAQVLQQGALAADAAADEMERVDKLLTQISTRGRTNQGMTDLARGWTRMVSETFSADEANRAIEQVGRIAAAINATVDDTAFAAVKLNLGLDIQPEGLEEVFDKLLYSSKQGSFSMADFATSIPDLATAAKTWGMSGVEGAVEIAALAQTMRRGYGTSQKASSAISRLMQQLMMPRISDRMEAEYGINLENVVKAAMARGESGFETALRTILEATGGEGFALSKIVGREESIRALNVLEKNWDFYQKLKKDVAAAEGLLDQDYVRQLDSVEGVFKSWRLQIEKFAILVGKALFPVLKNLLWILTPIFEVLLLISSEMPWLATILVTAAAALSAFVLLAPQIWAMIKIFGVLKFIVASMNLGGLIAGWLPAIPGFMKGLLTLKAAMAAFKAGGILTGLKIIGIGIAALLNPIGLVVLALVAVGAALVWLYNESEWFRDKVNAIWDGIATYFTEKWEHVKTFWGGVWDVLYGTFEWFVGLFTGDLDMMDRGWDRLTGGLSKMWEGAIASFNQDLEQFGKNFDATIEAIKDGWTSGVDFIRDSFKQLLDDLKAIVTGDFSRLGSMMGNSIVQGAAALIPGGGTASIVVPRASAFVSDTARTFGEWHERRQTHHGPARALGGPVMPGVSYLVGERRPEVLEIPSAGTARVWPSVAQWERNAAAAPALQLAAPTLPALGLEAPTLPRLGVEAPELEPLALEPLGSSRPSMQVSIASGAVQVHVSGQQAGDQTAIRRAVSEALDEFRRDLESSYRSLLND